MSIRLREKDNVLSNAYCDGPGASVPQRNQLLRDRTFLLVRLVSFVICHLQNINGKQSDWGDDRRALFSPPAETEGRSWPRQIQKVKSNYNATTS